MKIKRRKPCLGSLRIKSFFALFPIRIKNETRWLERVSVEQILVRYFIHGDIYDSVEYRWDNIRFIDPPVKKGDKRVCAS